MKFINQIEPSFNEREREAINEYMLSGGWLTEFEKTREFEKMIAEYTGANYAFITSNGTVSLVVLLSLAVLK